VKSSLYFMGYQELEDAESTKDKKFIKRKTILKKIVANITMGNDSKGNTLILSVPFHS
jgi:hypothetical protein